MHFVSIVFSVFNVLSVVLYSKFTGACAFDTFYLLNYVQQYLSYMVLECRERHTMMSRGMEPYRREIRFQRCQGHRPIIAIMFMPIGPPADDPHASIFDTAHGKPTPPVPSVIVSVHTDG